jgi:lambda repressor-like predicted transcriptional regulator
MENKIELLLDGRPVTRLAKKTGLHRNTIYSYIKGVPPSLENADLIAFAFGVSIYEVWPTLRSQFPKEE